MRLVVLFVLGVLSGCCGARDPIVLRQPIPYRITRVSDVSWMVERMLYIGTVRHVGGHVMLQLEADRAQPARRPPLLACRGLALPEGTRAAISAVSRRMEPEEQAVGAVAALAEIRREEDIAAPELAAYPILRREADFATTFPEHVTAEGVVRWHAGDFALELSSGELVRLVIVVEGVSEAKALLGKRRRVYGWLSIESRQPLSLAIRQPAFEEPRDGAR